MCLIRRKFDDLSSVQGSIISGNVGSNSSITDSKVSEQLFLEQRLADVIYFSKNYYENLIFSIKCSVPNLLIKLIGRSREG